MTNSESTDRPSTLGANAHSANEAGHGTAMLRSSARKFRASTQRRLHELLGRAPTPSGVGSSLESYLFRLRIEHLIATGRVEEATAAATNFDESVIRHALEYPGDIERWVSQLAKLTAGSASRRTVEWTAFAKRAAGLMATGRWPRDYVFRAAAENTPTRSTLQVAARESRVASPYASLRRIDNSSKEFLHTVEIDLADILALSRSARGNLVGVAAGVIREFDAWSGALVRRWEPDSEIVCAVPNADGFNLVQKSGDVIRFDVATSSKEVLFACGFEVASAIWSPCGRYALILGERAVRLDSFTRTWDEPLLVDGSTAETLSTTSAAFVVEGGGTYRFIGHRTNTPAFSLNADAAPRPTGPLGFFFGARDSDGLQLVEHLDSGGFALLRPFEGRRLAPAIAKSPLVSAVRDRDRLITLHENLHINVWTLLDGRVSSHVATLAGHAFDQATTESFDAVPSTRGAHSLVFACVLDDNHLFSLTSNGSARIWFLPDHPRVTEPLEEEARAKALAVATREAVREMTPNEKIVTAARWGVTDRKHDDASANVSDRVKEIEARALGRLRDPERPKMLRSFTSDDDGAPPVPVIPRGPVGRARVRLQLVDFKRFRNAELRDGKLTIFAERTYRIDWREFDVTVGSMSSERLEGIPFRASASIVSHGANLLAWISPKKVTVSGVEHWPRPSRISEVLSQSDFVHSVADAELYEIQPFGHLEGRSARPADVSIKTARFVDDERVAFVASDDGKGGTTGVTEQPYASPRALEFQRRLCDGLVPVGSTSFVVAARGGDDDAPLRLFYQSEQLTSPPRCPVHAESELRTDDASIDDIGWHCHHCDTQVVPYSTVHPVDLGHGWRRVLCEGAESEPALMSWVIPNELLLAAFEDGPPVVWSSRNAGRAGSDVWWNTSFTLSPLTTARVDELQVEDGRVLTVHDDGAVCFWDLNDTSMFASEDHIQPGYIVSSPAPGQPRDRIALRRALDAATGYLWDEFGREPTPEEIAEKLELPIGRLRRLFSFDLDSEAPCKVVRSACLLPNGFAIYLDEFHGSRTPFVEVHAGDGNFHRLELSAGACPVEDDTPCGLLATVSHVAWFGSMRKGRELRGLIHSWSMAERRPLEFVFGSSPLAFAATMSRDRIIAQCIDRTLHVIDVERETVWSSPPVPAVLARSDRDELVARVEGENPSSWREAYRLYRTALPDELAGEIHVDMVSFVAAHSLVDCEFQDQRRNRAALTAEGRLLMVVAELPGLGRTQGPG